MSDLEDDLLALAGGEDNTYESEEEIPLSKRKQATTEDDEDEISTKRRRVESGSEEEEDDDEFEVEVVNPYPLDGKYKDEEDRDRLDELDEVEREAILFERSQEYDKFKERRYLQQRMRDQQQLKSHKEPTRSSGRVKTGNVEKQDKLSELRKQREQHSRRKTRREADYNEESYEEEEDEDDEEGEGGEEEEEDEDEYLDDYGKPKWGGASKVKSKKSTELAKLEDVNRIKVGKTTLTQYCFYPGFDSTIEDTYGKVNLGMDRATRKPLYRMVKIIGVKIRKDRSYRLGNNRYDKYLTVSQNKTQTKDFPMSIFSDSPITSEEFERYLRELSKTNESIELLEDAKTKLQELTNFFNKGLTDRDIDEMIERKKEIKSRKGTISAYDAVKKKAYLMDQLKIAKQEGNFQKVQEIIDDIKENEEIIESQNAKKPESALSLVNERNRKLNSTNIRKAEIKNMANANQQTDGGDPFSRLKTTTRMFYQDLVNQENKKALADVNLQQLIDEKTKQEEKIAKSTYRDLGEMDKLIKGIDFEFELSFV
ncbi:RTF1 RNA polymerase-associated protein RTF1 [Candida maltosa Xu316]|uniref:Subunit of the RNA polymerase II-associated Paf1 complex, putative n=1 Tax=Candida maltosa (strain Xu316) TaxID=1245528 RepID=M3ILR3_CANMX|nr:Subunit of the RNA polymerase II-associated Paf1 complex, putative [Candida maltosa Xu316]